MEPSWDPHVLAIDLGTHGPKVGLVSGRGEILDWEFEPVPLLLRPGGGAEQSPDDWWTAIVDATHRLLDRRLVPVEKIAAVCCDAQWSGTVPVDRSGKPLMNAVIWLDTRGARYVSEVVRGTVSFQGYDPAKLLTWIRLTGGLPSASGKDPVGHILYIQRERPDVYRDADKFLEPKDYINLCLTGKMATSYDSIALHWLADTRQIDNVVYDERLFRLAGLDRKKFPELQRAAGILGSLSQASAAELGLAENVRVVMGLPDVHATAIGSGAVTDFQAHLYLGTSSWISCHVPYKRTDVSNGLASVPAGIPGRYLLVNEQEWAGGCLDYFIDNILYCPDGLEGGDGAPADVHALLNEMAAEAPPGAGGLIFTPWLYGERTPVNDPWVRGGFLNLSLNSTRSHLVRAVFEGVAYNARWLFGAVEKFVRGRLDGIRAVGGGAGSEFWCQIHADVLDRTILQVKDPRLGSLRGAAFQALVALGCMSFDDIPGRVPIAGIYHPNPDNRQIYDSLYHEFLQFYRRLRPVYVRLNTPK